MKQKIYFSANVPFHISVIDYSLLIHIHDKVLDLRQSKQAFAEWGRDTVISNLQAFTDTPGECKAWKDEICTSPAAIKW